MNNLTIKQLRYFDALARHQHFGRAADNLFWLGRYTERAESALRLLRIVFGKLGGATPPRPRSSPKRAEHGQILFRGLRMRAPRKKKKNVLSLFLWTV